MDSIWQNHLDWRSAAHTACVKHTNWLELKPWLHCHTRAQMRRTHKCRLGLGLGNNGSRCVDAKMAADQRTTVQQLTKEWHKDTHLSHRREAMRCYQLAEGSSNHIPSYFLKGPPSCFLWALFRMDIQWICEWFRLCVRKKSRDVATNRTCQRWTTTFTPATGTSASATDGALCITIQQPAINKHSWLTEGGSWTDSQENAVC